MGRLKVSSESGGRFRSFYRAGQQQYLFADALAHVQQREPYWNKRRQLKIGTHTLQKIVSGYFYRLEVRTAEAHLFGGSDYRQSGRFDIDQAGADSLTGDRVGSPDEPAQGSGPAAYGTGSVHRNYAVDYRQSGLEKPVYVDEQFAEIMLAMALRKVPQGLVLAGYAAEHVLDRERREQLLMCFELRQIYDDIGVESDGAYADAGTPAPDAALFRLIELL